MLIKVGRGTQQRAINRVWSEKISVARRKRFEASNFCFVVAVHIPLNANTKKFVKRF